MMMVWVASACLGLFAPSQARASGPADRDFETRLAADLSTRDAAAVQAFESGNDAREREAWEEAENHYRDALAIDPGFDHAERRRCSVLSLMGQHDEARAGCRRALQQADSPENQVGLMAAMAADPKPTSSSRKEVAELADRAMDGPAGRDPQMLPAICQATVVAERLDLLERCHRMISNMPGNEVETHVFGWMLAMSKNELGDAEEEIDAAEAAGLDAETVAELRQATSDAEPWLWTVGRGLGIAVVLWFCVFGVLVIVGIGLSRATLRSAESLPTTRSGHATGGAAALRKVYSAVLLLTCAFYYASLPLMLLLVLLLGGGVIYAMFAIGHISIKLSVVVLVATVVTIVTLAKSLFVRGEDQDPGERLDLTEAPMLRGLLDEVAQQVETRAVDNVYLVPGADIAVFERGGALEKLTGKSERCLILGIAVLDGMTAMQLKAILAHEYGHFSNRDTAGGGFALAVRRSMIIFAEGLANEGMATVINPSWLFVTSFYKLFLRISQGASRLQEVLADRWAVFSYGPDAFEGGLRHVIDRDVRFEMDTEAYLKAAVETKQPVKNLYEESYGHVSSDPKQDVEAQVQEILEAEPSPFDSHPRPVDRFRWARALECEAPVDSDPEASAWSVIGSKEALQLQMTEFVRDNVARMGHELPS